MRKIVALLLALAVSAGCTSPDSGPSPDFAGDYTISPADKIKVTVHGEKDFSGQFTVDADGTVLVPIAGPVTLAGLSLGDAAAAYGAKLRDGQILRSPKVKIEAVGVRPIFVLGEVNRPGQYAYAAGLTLRGAIKLAEGYAYYAQESSAEITRAGRTVEVDVDTEIKILPGDTVRVPKRLF
jgi:protein involved in polysaccharide export with SLBB domain